MTWQGVVFEQGEREQVLVIAAPTLLAAKRELLRKARECGWTVLRTELYPLRGTHSWVTDTWARHANGSTTR